MTALLLRLRGIIRKIAEATGLSDYAVLNTYEPDVVADFENEYYRLDGSDTTFTGLFNFQRASIATYTDANGNLQTAADNEPRIGHHEYDGSAWVNKGILLEDQSNNQIAYSEDWSQQTIGDVFYATLTYNGDVMRMQATNTGRFSTYTAGTGTYNAKDTTVSIDVRSTSGAPMTVQLRIKHRYSNEYVGPTVTVGADWTRISHSISGVNFFHPTGVTVYAVGTVDVEFRRPQVERFRLTPTSYIPTTGTPVTRAADVLTIPGANVTQGTVTSESLQGATLVDASNTPELILHGFIPTPTVYVSTDDDAGSVRYRLVYLRNDEDGETLLHTSSVPSGQVSDYNIAYRYGQGALQIAEGGTSSTAFAPSFAVGHSFYDSQFMSAEFNNGDNNGTIKLYRQWRTDITEAGIEEASS